MSQRVEYEALPGTRPDQYVAKLRAVLSILAEPEGTRFKPFRNHLRKLGIWDREKAPTMLSLVDLSWDRKEVRVGPLARKLAAAEDDDAFRDLLFERLRRDNILLVKYVLEALDVDAGGRLHSVHELYRMVTSYVYPGEYVTLGNFKAWCEWLAATGYIKLVGIRWALSDKGLSIIEEFRSMDVEEILEDLEEEAELGGKEEGAEAAAEPIALAESVAPPAESGEGVKDPEAAEEAEEDDDELFADLPPEPAPPSEAAVAQAEAAFTERFGAPPEEVAPAARPQGQAPALREPLPDGTPLVAPAVVGEGADAKELLDRIVGWWRRWDDWPAWTAPALGLRHAPEPPGDDLLVELGTLALLVEGLPVQPQGFAFARSVREAGFFEALAGDGGLGAALPKVSHLESEPWARPLLGRLVHAGGLAERVRAEPGILELMRSARDGAAAVTALRATLFGGAGTEAPFWVVRELVRLGVLAGEHVGDAAAVPTARLLRNAWRIGLVSRPEAIAFEELVAAARTVSSLFGAEAGWGEALEHMDLGLGLTAT